MKNPLLFILAYLFSINAFSQEFENLFFGCIDPELEPHLFQPPSVVAPPIPKLEIAFSEYKIDPEKNKKIISPSGTTIHIPANAFLNEKGKKIKGMVDLIYREFNNPIDIFLSGIPMMVENNGAEHPFQSAGMFEILAFKNGEEVFPNPNALIEVELNSNQLETDYRVYDLNEQTGKWNENGNNNATAPANWSNINWAEPPSPPVLKTDFISIVLLNKKSLGYAHNIRKPQFRLGTLADKWQNKITDNNYLVKKFQEIGQAKIKTWIYDGEMSKKELSDFFDRLNHVNRNFRWSSVLLKNDMTQKEIEMGAVRVILIEPDFSNNNYVLHLIRKEDTLHIPFYPYFQTNAPSVEQKRNEKFYEKYKNNYELRKREWAELNKRNKAAMSVYNTASQNYETWALANGIDPNNPSPRYMSHETLKLHMRRVKINEFGIKNIDKLLKKRGDEVEIEILTDNLILASCHSIHLLDKTNNAVVPYYGNRVRFVKKAKNSLAIMATNGHYAFISAKEFAAALEKRKNGKIQLRANFIDPGEMSKEDLKDGLAVAN